MVTSFLVRGSLTSIAARFCGVALGYAAHVLLSRFLGLHDYGAYVVALGWALVLTLPARMGFDQSALRYSTVYLEAGRAGSLMGFVRVASASVILSSLVAALAMVLLVGRLSGSIGDAAIFWAAVCILPFALLSLASTLIRTTKRIFASQFYDQLLRPGILILLLLSIATLPGTSLDAAKALAATAAAATAALVGAVVHLRRVFKQFLGERADYTHWRDWLSLSIPILIMGVMQELLNQLEIVLLGSMAGSREAGLFSAAWRLASLAPFFLAALSTVSGPLVASAYHRRDWIELHRITSLSARLGLGFAVTASFLLLLTGRPLLAIFGPEFPQAYPALAILLAGAVVNAFTGIVGYLLTLTGRQTEALVIFVAALLVSVVLNLLLIPRFGIVGAAVASASALSCWNLVMVAYVRRTLGIDASALGLRRRGLR